MLRPPRVTNLEFQRLANHARERLQNHVDLKMDQDIMLFYY